MGRVGEEEGPWVDGKEGKEKRGGRGMSYPKCVYYLSFKSNYG
jgi:hypothetical protein